MNKDMGLVSSGRDAEFCFQGIFSLDLSESQVRSAVLPEDWMERQLTLSCFSKSEMYGQFLLSALPNVCNVSTVAEPFAQCLAVFLTSLQAESGLVGGSCTSKRKSGNV